MNYFKLCREACPLKNMMNIQRGMEKVLILELKVLKILRKIKDDSIFLESKQKIISSNFLKSPLWRIMENSLMVKSQSL